MTRVLVFDFDGTLVDSNRLKYQAYFEIFPDSPGVSSVIRGVLDRIYEASRYAIIEEIVRQLRQQGLMEVPEEDLESAASRLAEQYGRIVLEGVKQCPEIPGAGSLLEELFRIGAAAYLSSTTPEGPLRQLVEHRGWSRFFKGVFGHPRRKEETLKEIMEAEGASPRETMVIGDGESDRAAAEKCGTAFAPVESGRLPTDLILKFARC